MLRIFSILIGLALSFVLALGLWSSITTESQPEGVDKVFHLKPKAVDWSFEGPFGKYDTQQLQRGFFVFKSICSNCHSLKLVAFRDLEQIGYSAGQVKAIAGQWQIEQPSINPETGEPATRKNVASDHFPLVYANEDAAKAANGGAVPPDLSLMAKAREDGPNYIHALLTGYGPIPPELSKEFPDFKVPSTLHFNRYFPTLALAMPPPLTADTVVQYDAEAGAKGSVDQNAKDVAAFLTWAAEPKMGKRHMTGLAVMGFLLIFTLLAFGAYRNIWRDMKH